MPQLCAHIPNIIASVNGEVHFIERLALFPDFSLIEATAPIQGSKWERYVELRSQVVDLEASLAEEWFSPELKSSLRRENLQLRLPPVR